MQIQQLGITDLKLTRIGLGTWAIGGGNWKFSWGPQDDGDSIKAMKKVVIARYEAFGTAGNADRIRVVSLADMGARYDQGALKPVVH